MTKKSKQEDLVNLLQEAVSNLVLEVESLKRIIYPSDEEVTDVEALSESPIVEYVNKSKYEQLTKKFDSDSGYDIRADMDIPAKLVMVGTVVVVNTKLKIKLPVGYEAQIRPRSGNAVEGLTIVNSPGTIDENYVGDIKVIVANLSNEPFKIEDGDRIAQVVFVKKDPVNLVKMKGLSATDRGEGGFGHTGKK